MNITEEYSNFSFIHLLQIFEQHDRLSLLFLCSSLLVASAYFQMYHGVSPWFRSVKRLKNDLHKPVSSLVIYFLGQLHFGCIILRRTLRRIEYSNFAIGSPTPLPFRFCLEFSFSS